MITCEFEDGHRFNLRHVSVDNIVLDHQAEKVLLVRRSKNLSNPGKLALPGGYLAKDETIAEGAIRETFEETGYKCEITKLLVIVDNPKRAQEDRQNVAFIHLAKATDKLGDFDKNEVDEIIWYDLNHLPDKSEFAFDHFQNLELYLQYRARPFALPVFRSQ